MFPTFIPKVLSRFVRYPNSSIFPRFPFRYSTGPDLIPRAPPPDFWILQINFEKHTRVPSPPKVALAFAGFVSSVVVCPSFAHKIGPKTAWIV